MNVLIAGATGHLGRHLVPKVQERGYRARLLVRDLAKASELKADEVIQADLRRPNELEHVCKGVEMVFSCAGASLDLRNWSDRATYDEIDYKGNSNLLDAAVRAGVGRFIYVSLHNAQAFDTEYSAAHERFVERLKASKLSATVIRPTGFFYMFKEFLNMAWQGQAFLIGEGACRTNPIHEADLAEYCLEAFNSQEEELSVGGPEVFTRRQIVEMCFEVLGSTPRITTLSPRIVLGMLPVVRLFHRRMADLLHFGTKVGLVDVVAPAYGTRKLRAYLQEAAGLR